MSTFGDHGRSMQTRFRHAMSGFIVAAFLAFMAGASSVRADSAAAPPPAPPAATPAFPEGAYNATSIRHTAAANPADPQNPSASPSSGYNFPRVAMALGAVIGLVFLLRWGSRRFFVLPTSGASSRAVQVLSRSILAPKQQVMLIQVGRRVLVVGDSGGHMAALCDITDPDEIAALVGQLQTERSTPISKTFGSLFGRSKGAFESAGPALDLPEADDGPEMADDSGSEHGDEPAAQTALREPVGFSDSEAQQAVAGAQQELSGLMKKVRSVSKQFRGS